MVVFGSHRAIVRVGLFRLSSASCSVLQITTAERMTGGRASEHSNNSCQPSARGCGYRYITRTKYLLDIRDFQSGISSTTRTPTRTRIWNVIKASEQTISSESETASTLVRLSGFRIAYFLIKEVVSSAVPRIVFSQNNRLHSHSFQTNGTSEFIHIA